jgi:hypothetical protein
MFNISARAAQGRRQWGDVAPPRTEALPPPNSLQIHGDRLEGFRTDDIITTMRCEQYPVFGLEAVDFEGFREGIEQPEVGTAACA